MAWKVVRVDRFVVKKQGMERTYSLESNAHSDKIVTSR